MLKLQKRRYRKEPHTWFVALIKTIRLTWDIFELWRKHLSRAIRSWSTLPALEVMTSINPSSEQLSSVISIKYSFFFIVLFSTERLCRRVYTSFQSFDLHFFKLFVFFFWEYLIILPQSARKRSGDWLFKNLEVGYATYISKVSPPIAHRSLL